MIKNAFKLVFALVASLLTLQNALAQTKPRGRDLGIPFDGQPGPLDAITDVKGVEVGHVTLISGSGKLVVGYGPVRTGVTAILPRGKSKFALPRWTFIFFGHILSKGCERNFLASPASR